MIDTILNGDALSILQTLPDASVDMCVTSPPYWGLRDYGVDGQLGLESSFDEYIDKLVAIFDEVRRVLKDAGTLWVNISDSYGGSGSPGGDFRDGKGGDTYLRPYNRKGVTPKSLCGIPERFVIAMTDRGWIRRNTVIWYKPNCMPSSVKDRFTVDFEYLYFFSKNPKYYFEQQLEESARDWTVTGGSLINDTGWHRGAHKTPPTVKDLNKLDGSKRNMRCVWRISTKPYKGAHFAVFPEDLIETPIKAGCPPGGVVLDPFMGSGTTASVAKRLGRHYIGIELNTDYLDLIRERVDNTTAPLTIYNEAKT